ncbi:hypothetical protein K469DRAFT_156324 [Zopfia rhizophila CBS 207.26]|uniref:Uncharacterized protein n=1 Tax=Zopfia rhizophila CBS 207.26 TaxID=1314779 RepID=A0A6A6E3K6_9PEZI|nr:hypothetical protein K469DRAFT_156324 [Zopfia rhizophila CBS 207.26]
MELNNYIDGYLTVEVRIPSGNSIFRPFIAVHVSWHPHLKSSSLAGWRQDSICLIRSSNTSRKHRPKRTFTEAVTWNMELTMQNEPFRTPVTSGALASLRDQIKQDTYMLDSPGNFHLQKLTYAAEKAFAECALLLDENRLLFEQKENRSWVLARSTVIGKAK